ncbi:MAG: histidine kinase N-terminal domain-containing protein [Chloroflexi bacterium]|nr:histidine kinase N-terminal domain-containing protein [Chloroflexota bacterium]
MQNSVELAEKDRTFLQRIEGGMGIIADISRADLLLYVPKSTLQVVLLSQARPHSVPPIHETMSGAILFRDQQPAIFRALREGKPTRFAGGQIAEGAAPIVQEVLPVRNPEGKVIAALSIEKTMIEEERHKRRSPVFRQMVKQLHGMLLRGGLEGAEVLSPFGEHDGLVVVDGSGRIRYVSGIANNLYRRLGYMENLVGKYIDTLETADSRLVRQVLGEGKFLEDEAREGNRIWQRKLIPFAAEYSLGIWNRLWAGFSDYVDHGVLVIIHDATLVQRQERELRVKTAMIREIHHRVKNNLQTIAALLRLQARRTDSGEARQALRDSLHRILSVAVIHEYLSQEEVRIVNLREVARRVIEQLQDGVMDREKQISLQLEGPNISLPAQQATACALVINELLQNSLEHGYERRREGTITVNLNDGAEQVTISIQDDGRGLPSDFNLDEDASLGLRIVQTLVEEDLKGRFQIQGGRGVQAAVTFPKTSLGKSEPWEEE